MHDYKRPPTLHRYAPRAELEAALSLGQFRLVPANNCLTLSFSQAWDKALFEVFAPADCCLVIALLFLGDTTNLPLDKYIAALFVGAMMALIGAFVYLLREIFVASSTLRARRHKRPHHQI